MPDIQKIKIHIQKVHQGTGNEYILPSVKNPNLKKLQKHFHKTNDMRKVRANLKNICLDHPYSHPGMYVHSYEILISRKKIFNEYY